MADDSAHTSRWQIFEVIFGIPFLAALALQWLLPISFPDGLPLPVLRIMGALLILAGLRLIILTRREFARYRQPTDPGQPTSRLITGGVFSFSRNPLYLGGVMLLAGLALAFNLPWALALLAPSIIACRYWLILPEERYLAHKFGDEYRTYTTSVRRWIGRKGRK